MKDAGHFAGRSKLDDSASMRWCRWRSRGTVLMGTLVVLAVVGMMCFQAVQSVNHLHRGLMKTRQIDQACEVLELAKLDIQQQGLPEKQRQWSIALPDHSTADVLVMKQEDDSAAKVIIRVELKYSASGASVEVSETFAAISLLGGSDS